MPYRLINRRRYWLASLFVILVLMVGIRWYVHVLGVELRREGLSSRIFVAARSVLLDALDVETGLRGYLISGHDDFLRPYHEGIGRLVDDLARLRASVGQDPVELPHADAVSVLSQQVRAEFAGQVSLADREGIDAARNRFVANPTKPAMDEIREHLTSILAEESQRIAANRAALDAQMQTAIFLIDAMLVLVAVMLFAMACGLAAPFPQQPRPPVAC